MKFTHRTAGPRKGTGASPVKVKAERKPKPGPLCKRCGEHHAFKCTCHDDQKSFVRLGDFLP